ncbi:MAG: tRNA uridine-5-carboxymethylaminomethyl(34) synthesis GTPase MnmE, partial [Bacteroidales bacterium]|nr:tRNA uridine-5-carboxymethylaminomethyl(34) synthesis GTPase MnmE [Bacteroidales bacterium]
PAHTPLILAINKSDLPPQAKSADTPPASQAIPISAKTGAGIPALLDALRDASGAARVDAGDLLITNARHAQALTAALAPLRRVAQSLATQHSSLPTPLDLVAQDLREALHHISSITTPITTPDLLATIFSRFCVGK